MDGANFASVSESTAEAVAVADSRALTSSNASQASLTQDMLRDLNLKYLQCVQVPHRGYATALVMRHATG